MLKEATCRKHQIVLAVSRCSINGSAHRCGRGLCSLCLPHETLVLLAQASALSLASLSFPFLRAFLLLPAAQSTPVQTLSES